VNDDLDRELGVNDDLGRELGVDEGLRWAGGNSSISAKGSSSWGLGVVEGLREEVNRLGRGETIGASSVLCRAVIKEETLSYRSARSFAIAFKIACSI